MTSFENVVMCTMRIARSVRTLRDSRVPLQVGVGSRKVRTDLARRFATAASIDQILFAIVVVSVSSRVCCFLFLFWRFRVSFAWCFAFRRVGFLEEYMRAARACSLC